MTQIREAMSGPVVAVDQNAAAADAARLMGENDTGDDVVMDGGRLVGIVTDRDLALRVVAEGMDPYVSVSEILTTDPATIAPDEDLTAASELMKEHAIRRLPVCDRGEVVGFISLGDLSTHVDADATLTAISSAPANG